MTIAIKINQAARARELKADNPFMTEEDIAALTGMPLRNVQSALRRRPKGDARKSRAR